MRKGFHLTGTLLSYTLQFCPIGGTKPTQTRSVFSVLFNRNTLCFFIFIGFALQYLDSMSSLERSYSRLTSSNESIRGNINVVSGTRNEDTLQISISQREDGSQPSIAKNVDAPRVLEVENPGSNKVDTPEESKPSTVGWNRLAFLFRHTRRHNTARSYSSWYIPTKMIIFLICGLSVALGHHKYWLGLNETEITDAGPRWPQVFGVALAFFVKSALVGAVQVAYKQGAWVCDPAVTTIVCFHAHIIRSLLSRRNPSSSKQSIAYST